MNKLLNLFRRRNNRRDQNNRILDIAVLLRERRISKRHAAVMLEDIVFKGGEQA